MEAALIIIDFQERLARHIAGIEEIVRNVVKLIRACKILGIPMILTEQVKLGETVEEIRRLVDAAPIIKSSFSCAGCREFNARLEELRPEKCILTGIEAHICVLQTALDLRERGYEVQVAVDCVGSRRELDKRVAIWRMCLMGVIPTTSETAIYELLKTADHERFKEVLEIVKG